MNERTGMSGGTFLHPEWGIYSRFRATQSNIIDYHGRPAIILSLLFRADSLHGGTEPESVAAHLEAQGMDRLARIAIVSYMNRPTLHRQAEMAFSAPTLFGNGHPSRSYLSNFVDDPRVFGTIRNRAFRLAREQLFNEHNARLRLVTPMQSQLEVILPRRNIRDELRATSYSIVDNEGVTHSLTDLPELVYDPCDANIVQMRKYNAAFHAMYDSFLVPLKNDMIGRQRMQTRSDDKQVPSLLDGLRVFAFNTTEVCEPLLHNSSATEILGHTLKNGQLLYQVQFGVQNTPVYVSATGAW